MGEHEGQSVHLPLFETKAAKGRIVYKVFACTVLLCICWIWFYRLTNFPSSSGVVRWWVWIGMFIAEVWFGLYWILTQSVRWNVIYRQPFKDRLSLRYEDKLPSVDVFVCTADPRAEPPTLVINTVLSTMAYNYPTQKLAVYLSDDGGSEFTFYALLEASQFSKHWLPFCNNFKVESRSPAAYFTHNSIPKDTKFAQQHLAVKKLYEEMKIRIENAMENGNIPEDIKNKHNGFLEWNSVGGSLTNKTRFRDLSLHSNRFTDLIVAVLVTELSSCAALDVLDENLDVLDAELDVLRVELDVFLELISTNSTVTKQDHHSIVKILIDGRNPNEVDVDGVQLPTLVYLAREKKPQYPHNFKAGSMNALIRVSSEISNGSIILNVDCDMYSNDSDAIRNSLCFFMDEQHGHETSYVQYPQRYENITKNDIYANKTSVVNKMELRGIDGYGGALYCGTGCFHRRESLCGMKCLKKQIPQYENINSKNKDKTIDELEESSKVVANCSFEKGTQWGKEMGLVYGCPVEDIVTGLTIQCRGWRPVFYNPEKAAFLGVAPITLELHLIQMKRWSEGMFQIFFSKYCPFIYGHSKIKFGAQMGYCVYLLWAPCSVPALYYVLVPPLCLLRGIALFPKVSSIWFLPFAYVFVARNVCSMVELLKCGDTLKAWWNSQRMLVIRRTTSYLFGFADTLMRHFGFSETNFTVTEKVVDEEVVKRYEQDIMDFGSDSIFFNIISTLALVNFSCLVMGIVKRAFVSMEFKHFEDFVAQISLCVVMVLLNLPVYQALFFRSDKGQLPSSVMFKSIAMASLMCLVAIC